jgi:dTDP-4-dehydrorhamnose 3,5-epimerase-like enzyme
MPKARILKLERIVTSNKNNKQNGIFIPIWRNWDSKYVIDPNMVYFMTILIGDRKGPHLHKNRTGYITCLSGKVELVIRNAGNYESIICDSDQPQSVEILPGVGLLAINIGEEPASLLNICSPAWHPDNPDSYADDFSDYSNDNPISQNERESK